MLRKNVSGIILTLLLIAMSILASEIQPVEASITIYIRADGSIDPPASNITSVDDLTYYFTDDNDGQIVVQRNDIVIDGNGYLLTGAADGTGLLLENIYNVTIQNINIKHGWGINLLKSSRNTIKNNNITANNDCGINLWYSDNNTITGNSITVIDPEDYFSSGISLDTSFRNIIKGNNINNCPRGLCLVGPMDFHYNLIYHNNILDNEEIYIYGSWNNWSSSYPIGGNYWGNIGDDSNKDGIVDQPYRVNSDWDLYPLMGMFSSFQASHVENVNIISNSTIEDFWFFESNGTIRMHVLNVTTHQMVGFCRVCVPKDLMAPDYAVTVDGAEPHYVNYSLYDNGTHRWIYFAYEHSTREILLAHIPIFGDLNNDRIVDMRDIAVAALTFGSYPDHPRWNPKYDFNEDSEIDLADLLLIAKNFGI